ncbi:MAG TPA: ribosomal-processing cysteine protease Prp [Sediminispirochaeta sp.]|nr:ribosomal-processing cysteine protease Prp [Sediminispirochaeta sp.]
MIRAELHLDSHMCLRGLVVEGHAAKGSPGLSVPCAAVSALVRTSSRLIAAEQGVVSSGEAEKEGRLKLQVKHCAPPYREWLRGITDFVVVGLKEIERDYPDDCVVELYTQEENRNGA